MEYFNFLRLIKRNKELTIKGINILYNTNMLTINGIRYNLDNAKNILKNFKIVE